MIYFEPSVNVVHTVRVNVYQ